MSRAKATVYAFVLILMAAAAYFGVLSRSAFQAGEPWIGAGVAAFGVLFAGVAVLLVWAMVRPEYTGPALRSGQVRRFRVRRQSTTLSYVAFFAGAAVIYFLIMKWGPAVGLGVAVALVGAGLAWLFLGPVPGGRRTYVVSEDGLAIRTPTGQSTIAWKDVESVRHFPFVAVPVDGGAMMRRYDDRVELTVAGTDGAVTVAGANRQTVLSAIIVSCSADHVKRRLIETFDKIGEVGIGGFRVAGDGVHADGRLLPWSTAWTFERNADQNGVVLKISCEGERHLAAAVPEPRVAIDVLRTLNDRASR
jgi:hypothetical protein